MTDIDTMSLDELRIAVAREVMGWSDFWTDGNHVMGEPPHERQMGIDSERIPVPDYPRNIAAAWLVLDQVTQPIFGANHNNCNTTMMNLWQNNDVWSMTSEEAARFICRAALKAIRT